MAGHTVLITGGAGFIGSNLVRRVLATTEHRIVILDALTYAGNLENLEGVDRDRVLFVHGDITDTATVSQAITTHNVDGIINCAAESHVDRSISSAAPFVTTNVMGTLVLLEAARAHGLRFLQMSTDEVYGDLESGQAPVNESAPICTSSPYAASKASADLMVQAFVRTHGLHAVITRCTNNYGPFQFPEKFLPVMILKALSAQPLPIYGDGKQVRDWIHVDDHCAAVMLAYEHGRQGAVYNIGPDNERCNIDVAMQILTLLGKDASLLQHVTDRPGHDRRYAVDATRIRTELGWKPMHNWETSLRETVDWYAEHRSWCERIKSGAYREVTSLTTSR
ncbi:MAG: dTDP-glucose 4,6-dehydratase [Candidatus Kapabacteria bacterium]|nr:dTDP-glucose 4,6-dehydratase [Candidatus Kapabacteria bacterium]